MTEVRVYNAEARVITMTEARMSNALQHAALTLMAIIAIPYLFRVLGLINQIKRVIVTYE